MESMFGTDYFGFIASAYTITAVVLIGLLIWVRLTYSKRKQEMDRLERFGIRRASSQ